MTIFPHHQKIRDPRADWGFILACVVLVAVILIGIGSYIYVETQQELHGSGTTGNNALSKNYFDATGLKRIISIFDARANKRVLLDKGSTAPKDPSLP